MVGENNFTNDCCFEFLQFTGCTVRIEKVKSKYHFATFNLPAQPSRFPIFTLFFRFRIGTIKVAASNTVCISTKYH